MRLFWNIFRGVLLGALLVAAMRAYGQPQFAQPAEIHYKSDWLSIDKPWTKVEDDVDQEGNCRIFFVNEARDCVLEAGLRRYELGLTRRLVITRLYVLHQNERGTVVAYRREGQRDVMAQLPELTQGVREFFGLLTLALEVRAGWVRGVVPQRVDWDAYVEAQRLHVERLFVELALVGCP